MLLRQLANDLRIQWIEVVHRLRSTARGQPHRGGVAERVEERQHAHHHIGRLQIEQLVDGIDVTANVVLREHDPLGLAGGTAGKDD